MSYKDPTRLLFKLSHNTSKQMGGYHFSIQVNSCHRFQYNMLLLLLKLTKFAGSIENKGPQGKNTGKKTPRTQNMSRYGP